MKKKEYRIFFIVALILIIVLLLYEGNSLISATWKRVDAQILKYDYTSVPFETKYGTKESRIYDVKVKYIIDGEEYSTELSVSSKYFNPKNNSMSVKVNPKNYLEIVYTQMNWSFDILFLILIVLMITGGILNFRVRK